MSEPQKRRRSCFFFGCLTGIVCLVAILIAFLIGLHQFKKMLAGFTDTQPMPLPVSQMPRDQADKLMNRVNAFRDAVRAGKTAEPLTLTADELNALIATDPDLGPLKGKLYVTIDGSLLKAQVSLPLDEAGLRIFRGRYLNGEATLRASLQNGVLQVTPDNIVVKGKPLPGLYMDKLRTVNLAESFNSQPQIANALSKLQSLSVEGGRLVLGPKPANP